MKSEREVKSKINKVQDEKLKAKLLQDLKEKYNTKEVLK